MSVIIIGGGMAGTALALALSHLTEGNVAIDLVEATLPSDDRHPGFDNRSIALAQGTCLQLEQIGAWSAFKDSAEPITDIHVSDRGHFGLVNLSAHDYQLPAFGQVIELCNTGERLFSLLKRQNVRIHCPAKLVAINRTERQIEVSLDNGEVLSARLAVAADGSYSPLATAANMSWKTIDYQHIAITANVRVSLPQRGQAFERFTATGPLALLPMTQNRYSLVWCHPLNRADEVLNWSEDRFMYQLQLAFGWRLGAIEKVGKRSGYPLTLRYAERQTGHRLALVSNASQTLHPIAGQGFNLGLRDVMTLAEIVSEAKKHDEDLGGYSVLQRYQLSRRDDRRRSIALTDGLIGLFANGNPFLAGPRNLAMLAMNSSQFLLNSLVMQAIGQPTRPGR